MLSRKVTWSDLGGTHGRFGDGEEKTVKRFKLKVGGEKNKILKSRNKTILRLNHAWTQT